MQTKIYSCALTYQMQVTQTVTTGTVMEVTEETEQDDNSMLHSFKVLAKIQPEPR